MSSSPYILALDQGTTSTRAVLFDRDARVVASAQREIPLMYPQPGWVEHDPELIWETVVEVCREAAGDRQVAAMGITNQRETVVLWERSTGKPLHNAIVWQDRRTADLCRQAIDGGLEPLVQERTGLLLDPYFSASKIAWLLEHIPAVREAADRNDLMAGTIDCFLLWRLTGGTVHATDATNAARTMLFNIHSGTWDPELLDAWSIPATILPEVRDCNAAFGTTLNEIIGQEVPITGMAGDQHAATIGQSCFTPGMAKCTYGTGAFLVLNTGDSPVTSANRLLTTLAYQIDGKRTYALEGSIFSAGSAVQWLRDGLGIIPDARASQVLAEQLEDNGGVYMVPAFTGLGAPYWDPDARGTVVGITRDTGPARFARAVLESVGYQTLDLIRAMEGDSGEPLIELRIDGGMVANDWLCQFVADMVECPVRRPANIETTVLGAALLAGLGAGIYPSLEALGELWQDDRSWTPQMDGQERTRLYDGWLDAIDRTRSRR